jgi:hypothetical protein
MMRSSAPCAASYVTRDFPNKETTRVALHRAIP